MTRPACAALVVVDLRGNGGGSSSYGRELADILFGKARVEAVLGPLDQARCAGSVWRTSPRNVAQLRSYVERFGTDKARGARLRALFDDVETARIQGREFSGMTECSERKPMPVSQVPAAAAQGRIVLLTDHACFSSCLLVADAFRRLGALHVGGTTNANTHFSEVREDALPSGLAMFSTLQGIMPNMPRAIGPYEPELRYDGYFNDTAALEAWIAASVTH